MNITEYADTLYRLMIYNMDLLRRGRRREELLVPIAWSEPGIGKTQALRDVADRLGNAGWDIFPADNTTASTRWTYSDADFSSRDSADLGGSPWVRDGATVRLRPDWLPSQPMTLLGLDELAQAPLANLNIAGNLIREGRVGEHHLANGVLLACASNPSGSRTGTIALPGQIRSRLIHFEITADANQWAKYAEARDFDPILIAYNRLGDGSHHHKYDPTALAYPCARSWETANTVLAAGLPPAAEEEALAGCVGHTEATGFLAFREAARTINLNAIIANPTTAPLPANLGLTFVTLRGLAKRANHANLSAIVTYVNRIPEPEFATIFVSDATKRDPSLNATPVIAQWRIAHGMDLTLAAAA